MCAEPAFYFNGYVACILSLSTLTSALDYHYCNDDLSAFGSNTKPQDIINFARIKYNIGLKYNQVYYLQSLLGPAHTYGDGADFVLNLKKKDF